MRREHVTFGQKEDAIEIIQDGQAENKAFYNINDGKSALRGHGDSGLPPICSTM
jgi:hypothetical protein